MFYKVVRVLEDCRRVSSFADGDSTLCAIDTPSAEILADDYKMLEYHSGRLISAPKGTNGIYLADNYNLQTRMMDYSPCHKAVAIEAYEVTPIGKIVLHGGYHTCRVVRIGKLFKRVELNAKPKLA